MSFWFKSTDNVMTVLLDFRLLYFKTLDFRLPDFITLNFLKQKEL